MSKCKQCGAKRSFWSPRPDGFCNDCGAKADEIAKQEAVRKEAERKQRVLEDCKTNIDTIVRAMALDEPVCYTFVNWNIQEAKNNGNGGAIMGGLMFGLVGAMIGSALSSSSQGCSGQLGVLVVTRTQILIGHFLSPFQSVAGKITPDHLKLFATQLKSNALTRIEFNILQTQLPPPTATTPILNLVSAAKRLAIKKSELYVNDGAYHLPDVMQIHRECTQLGALVTPSQFIAKLLKRDNPISETHFNEIRNDKKYFSDVFLAIWKDQNRDILVKNFPCLAPSVKQILEERIKSLADTFDRVRFQLFLWSSLAILGAFGIALTSDGWCFLSTVGTVASVIASINSAIKLRQAIWCRNPAIVGYTYSEPNKASNDQSTTSTAYETEAIKSGVNMNGLFVSDGEQIGRLNQSIGEMAIQVTFGSQNSERRPIVANVNADLVRSARSRPQSFPLKHWKVLAGALAVLALIIVVIICMRD